MFSVADKRISNGGSSVHSVPPPAAPPLLPAPLLPSLPSPASEHQEKRTTTFIFYFAAVVHWQVQIQFFIQKYTCTVNTTTRTKNLHPTISYLCITFSKIKAHQKQPTRRKNIKKLYSFIFFGFYSLVFKSRPSFSLLCCLHFELGSACDQN